MGLNALTFSLAVMQMVREPENIVFFGFDALSHGLRIANIVSPNEMLQTAAKIADTVQIASNSYDFFSAKNTVPAAVAVGDTGLHIANLALNG